MDGKQEYINRAMLTSNTNSTIFKSDSHGLEYASASCGGWLIVAKINDTTKTSTFIFNESDTNIVFGIK